MEVTRRFWGLAASGAALATLALVFARPVLLLGAAGVGALLFLAQYRFVQRLQSLDATLTVDQSLPVQYVKKDDETAVTLAARLGEPSALDLQVRAELLLVGDGPSGEQRTLTLEPGDQASTTTFTVSWPVVGRATFEEPTVTVADPYGLFREALPRGPTPTVTVEPRVPRNVHVGEGGDQGYASFGGHRSDQLGSGTDPAEIREYVPGDSVRNIDWKATARLDTPHVREYEVETDQQTVLLFDHRARLATGREGETPLEYLREVALTVAESAEGVTDPLGLATVDDGGITSWERPSTKPETYETVRTTLLDLESGPGDTAPGTPGQSGSSAGQGPGRARRKATLLAGDDSAYSQRVRPFFGEPEGYVQQLTSDQLFEATRIQLGQVSEAAWVLIFTDDADRARLRETVKLARQQAAGVVVFVTPRVLFERDGLTDLDDAYEEFVAFEEFRRELARLDGVSALEVAPGERIDAVLAAGRERRGD